MIVNLKTVPIPCGWVFFRRAKTNRTHKETKMSWIKYAAVAIPLVVCLSGCNPFSPAQDAGKGKKTGLGGGGSVVTGNSGSFTVQVASAGLSSTNYLWSCDTTNTDCSTTPPPGSTLKVYVAGSLVYPPGASSGQMNTDWNIDVTPHLVQLESITIDTGTSTVSALHAYANGKGDTWTLSGDQKTITHSNNSSVTRIVITDPMTGRTLVDCPASGACALKFTVQ
jgi:hypothetical protein